MTCFELVLALRKSRVSNQSACMLRNSLHDKHVISVCLETHKEVRNVRKLLGRSLHSLEPLSSPAHGEVPRRARDLGGGNLAFVGVQVSEPAWEVVRTHPATSSRASGRQE